MNAMRFRQVPTQQVFIWIFLALFWLAESLDNVHRYRARHNPGQATFYEVMTVIWIIILLIYLYGLLFCRVEFDPTSLRLRIGFRSTRIPYDNIVAARPVLTSKGKIIPHQVELETARLSPSIYPHDYRRIAVADPDAFIRALRDKAPHAEQEPV